MNNLYKNVRNAWQNKIKINKNKIDEQRQHEGEGEEKRMKVPFRFARIPVGYQTDLIATSISV